MELERGTEVAGRYTIERKLGQGGMGAVYVAHDTKFGEDVALKIAAAAGGAYAEFKNRFIREARIGNRLGRASGFVRAFDWGELPGSRLYLAMDLVRGAQPLDLLSGDLPQRLQRLAVAAVLVGQAHRAGIVHRDLKPENYLQSADGSISLTDFGLAKLMGEELRGDSPTDVHLTTSRVGMGTPRYMAPEQFEDAKNVDARADVYSLGVMLFLALTGHFPYEGESIYAFVSLHTRVRLGELPPPGPRDVAPSLPLVLDALCREAIALDPADRLGDVEVLVERLEAALGEEGREGVNPSPTGVGAEGFGPADVVPPPTPRGRETLPPPTPPPRPRKLKTPRWAPPPALPAGVEATEDERLFRCARDGSLLVWVPPGTFRMGSKDSPAAEDERPLFRAELTRGYFIGRDPVTWAQLRTFCEQTGWAVPDDAFGPGDTADRAGPGHPAFNCTWPEASAYCQWAGLRLPTEAEWEYAARGKDGRVYPWGDDPPTQARCRFGADGTASVGGRPAGASPFGAYDMAGNVWEWVADWYGRYSRWVKSDPAGPDPTDRVGFKVARGGSWSAPAEHCRTTTRRMFEPALRAPGLGFRVACS